MIGPDIEHPENDDIDSEIEETEDWADEAEGSEEMSPLQLLAGQLSQERDQYKDLYMRTLADFQTFRRRTQGEKEQLRKTATESLVRDLLPVLDNFERTLAAIDGGATQDAIVDGVKMVDNQLRTVLEGVKVCRIQPLGEHFDPEHHEAIATEESSSHEPGTVTAVLESGYRMHDRVIRAAKVKVAKHK